MAQKQIARLVGVAPMNRDSGQFRGKWMIVGGAPMSVYGRLGGDPRGNPVIRTFYERLLANATFEYVFVMCFAMMAMHYASQ
jgi:transposase